MPTALIVLATVTACSEGVGQSDPTPTTTTQCSAPATTSPAGKTARPAVVPIDGSSDRSVGLPGALALPLIVHAHHAGRASFVVRGVDATGKDTQVLATALGNYDGTFPVGFVDACATRTVALHVATKGKWHLDIAEAVNARKFSGGVSGKDDSVFVYVGKAAVAQITYSGKARFAVTIYTAEGPRVLARSTSSYRGAASLPAGPVYVAVTAEGPWSFKPTQ